MFGCFKYIGIPFDTLQKMPTKDRKFYILKHNEYTEREKERYDGNNNSSNISGEMINAFTDVDQQASQNAKKR